MKIFVWKKETKYKIGDDQLYKALNLKIDKIEIGKIFKDSQIQDKIVRKI